MLTNCGPAVEPRDVDRLGELPGMHRGGADIAGLAGLHHVMQRLQRFLDRRRVVEAVDLVEIDIIGAEPAQAVVDLVEDRLARQAGAVRAGAHAVEHLGGEHDVLAPGEILDGAADDLLRGAVRIDIGGIEEIDPELERLADQRAARLLVHASRHGCRGRARHRSCSRGRCARPRGRSGRI